MLFFFSGHVYANDTKQDVKQTSKPIKFGLSKAKSQGNETPESKVNSDLLKSEKPKEVRVDIAPSRIVPDRKPGTITVKPIGVNFGSLTFGMSHKSQMINGYLKDPWRSSFAIFSNRSDTVGASYDFEAGIMLTSNIEAFAIVGIDYQRPVSQVVISNNNPAPFGQIDEFVYSFKSRRNYNVSLGGRYYWNTQKPWFPFLGLMGTVIFQDSIRANVYGLGPNPLNPTYPYLGRFMLQGPKRLWGGTFQVGADYQYTDWIAVTLMAGLQYTPRTHMTYTTISGKQISCRDNRFIWSVPVMAALKFTF